MSALGWWTISGEALLDAFRRVQAGDDPDLLYAELYANSEVTALERQRATNEATRLALREALASAIGNAWESDREDGRRMLYGNRHKLADAALAVFDEICGGPRA